MIIAVDFDGTIVQDKYPLIGEQYPHAFEVLKKWKEHGHILILWTCRNDNSEHPFVLQNAINFCLENGLDFDAVNNNYHAIGFCPYPKIYADVYIDDRSIFPPGKIDWNFFEKSIEKIDLTAINDGTKALQ